MLSPSPLHVKHITLCFQVTFHSLEHLGNDKDVQQTRLTKISTNCTPVGVVAHLDLDKHFGVQNEGDFSSIYQAKYMAFDLLDIMWLVQV